MHTAKLKLVAAVVASVGLLGLAGVGTVAAWPRTDLPVTAAAPAPPERPVEGDWIPAKPGDPVPTAFPGLKAPAPGDPNAFARACPRLSGKQPVTIEPTDDTYRRLLKAQLHQGQMEVDQRRTRIVAGHYTFADYTDWLRACTALGDLATELWANDPANAIPWLEELVVLAKENERISLARVQTGADPPHVLHAAVRHRLKTEAALWKARHPGGRAK